MKAELKRQLDKAITMLIGGADCWCNDANARCPVCHGMDALQALKNAPEDDLDILFDQAQAAILPLVPSPRHIKVEAGSVGKGVEFSIVVLLNGGGGTATTGRKDFSAALADILVKIPQIKQPCLVCGGKNHDEFKHTH